GGGQVHGAFLDQGLVDRVQIILSPKLVGGAEAPVPVAGAGVEAMEGALPILSPRVRRSGPDLILEGHLTPAGCGHWPPPVAGC
ncbi:MAG: dihydrofolate reductase family protein, partial [Planctomycetota bacterium]